MTTPTTRITLYVTIGFYLIFVFGVSIYILNNNRKKSLFAKYTENTTDHFLAGRNTNLLLLVLTTFATILSAYTLVGVPQEAFTTGFLSLRWVAINMSIVLSFAIITPRLRTISIQRNYSSPIDFITDRYHSETIRLIIFALLLTADMIFIAAQFTAISTLIETVTLGNIKGYIGAIFFGIIIIILEIIGGLQSVMITGAIQACVMIFCLTIVPIILSTMYGGFSELLESNNCDQTLPGKCGLNEQSQLFKLYPSKESIVSIGSAIFGFISFATLPQCTHRIYTASSGKGLRFAMLFQLATPYLTMISGVYVGILCAARLNSNIGSSAFAIAASELYNQGGFKEFISCLIMCFGLAVVSSTAFSALIALSHLFSEDIFQKQIKPNATSKEIILCSILFSMLIVAVSIGSLFIPNFDIYKCVVFQIAFQIQAWPAFFFGLFPEIFSPSSRSLIYGFFSALIFIFVFEIIIKGSGHVIYLDSGIWAFLLQIIVIYLCEIYFSKEHLDDDLRTYDLPNKSTLINFSRHMKSEHDFLSRLQTKEIMNVAEINITEPFGTTFNKKLLSLSVFINLISLPWYEESGTITSFVFGFPVWGYYFIAGVLISNIIVLYLIYNWEIPNETLFLKNEKLSIQDITLTVSDNPLQIIELSDKK
jgi:SSS family solute:Na+ symporter/sodium/proline symporter